MVGNFDEYISFPVLFNYLRLMSLKMADMAVSTQSITEKALNAVNQQQILTAIATKKLPWYRRLLGIGKKDEEEIRM